MRIALLGLGFMGSTHLKALQNIPDAQIVAVASDDPVKLTGDLTTVHGNLGVDTALKYDFSNYRKYADWAEVMNDPDVEAVDLCLPTHMHAPAALAALRAGKHVLIEKPMGLNGEETDAIMAEAEKSDRIVMTAQVLRFFPAYVALADVVKTGLLGSVRTALFRRRCAAPVWSTWLAEPKLSGGGVFDLLIHDVDQCLYLFGMPESISAAGYVDLKMGIDVINAEFHYPDIPSVSIMGGWHHPKAYPFSMEYTVVCDGGTVDYNSAGRAPTLFGANSVESLLGVRERDAYEAEIAYFVECCVQNKRPTLCPPEESAAAVKLARLMLDARERKGEHIKCNL